MPALTLVLLSDTHNRHREVAVPDGDVFLYAGDLTNDGGFDAIEDFNDWLGTLPHRHKVMICGNHDLTFESIPTEATRRITNAVYLQDSAVEVGGLKIWGSPWQPWFFSWAFNLHRGEPIAEKWKLIPPDTDILITHGPPQGIGDTTFRGYGVGCADLLARIRQVRPKLHLFGHIHEAAGVVDDGGTLFVNASSLTREAMRPPVVVSWHGVRMAATESEGRTPPSAH